MAFTVHFQDRDGNSIGNGFYSPVVPRFGELVQLPNVTEELFVTGIVYRAAGSDLCCAFVTVSPPITDEPFDDFPTERNPQ